MIDERELLAFIRSHKKRLNKLRTTCPHTAQYIVDRELAVLRMIQEKIDSLLPVEISRSARSWEDDSKDHWCDQCELTAGHKFCERLANEFYMK